MNRTGNIASRHGRLARQRGLPGQADADSHLTYRGPVPISSATRPFRPIVIFWPQPGNLISLCSHLIPDGENAGALAAPDLERVKDATRFGPALAVYLREPEVPDRRRRINLRNDREAVLGGVRPEAFALARWTPESR